jgi:hypothetical protein
MSDDTTTQSVDTESTSQPRSWRAYGPQFVNLHLVFWLILMTPSIVSLVLTWLLANTLHRGLVSVLTRDGSEGSTVESVAAKYNTQVWSPSSKNLKHCSMLYSERHQGWISNCPLSYLAPRNQRHPRPQKQQRNRRQPSQKTRLLHPVK